MKHYIALATLFFGICILLTTPLTAQTATDTDVDGMPDSWETTYGLNISVNDASLDTDSDSLSNLREYQYQTNPTNPDTDLDGLLDGQEVLENGPAVSIYSSTSINPSRAELKAATNGERYFIYWEDSGITYGKIIDLNGTIIKDTFSINTYGNQFIASTDIASDGTNFFVVWGEDNIYGQFYDANGNTIGDQFQVNEVEYDQNAPKAIFNGTDYCVTWYGYSEQNLGWDPVSYSFIKAYYNYIYHRTVTSQGTLGTEQSSMVLYEYDGYSHEDLNNKILSYATYYFILWQFDAWTEISGMALNNNASEIQTVSINEHTTGTQRQCTLTNLGNSYLATWSGEGSDTNNGGIYGRIFDSSGNAGTSQLQINTTTAGTQNNPVTASDGSNYCIAWDSYASGENRNIFYQKINTSGTHVGNETLLYSASADKAFFPSITSNNTDYCIVWTSGASNSYSLKGRFLTSSSTSDIEIAAFDSTSYIPAIVTTNGTNYLVLWYDGTQIQGSIVRNGLNTNPTSTDTDNDGLEDAFEINQSSTNPSVADTDNDGLGDGWEYNNGFNPNDSSDALGDPDNDGLSTIEELAIGTGYLNPDSDSDGINDGNELNISNTNPLISDTDNDGLNDGDEWNTYGSDPLDSDTDNDGMTDGKEAYAGMDPCDAQSFFKVQDIQQAQLDQGIQLTWTSTSEQGRSYYIYYKDDISNAWQAVNYENWQDGIIDNGDGTKSWTDASASASATRLYMVVVSQ